MISISNELSAAVGVACKREIDQISAAIFATYSSTIKTSISCLKLFACSSPSGSFPCLTDKIKLRFSS